MALGYTLQLPEEDRFLVSKQELSDRICVLLGGRVAEMIRYGDVTTGASNDLERATQIARQMVTQFGMSDKLGLVTLGRKQAARGVPRPRHSRRQELQRRGRAYDRP